MKTHLHSISNKIINLRCLSYFVMSLSVLTLAACGGGGGGAPASPGISISKTVLSTSEDGIEDSFAVKLKTKPSSYVDITYKSLDTTEGLIRSDTDLDSNSNFGTKVDLKFTPDNWNVPQTIQVQGQTDAIIDGNQTYSVVVDWLWSMDLSYFQIAQPSASVTNIDTSAPGATISSVTLTTAENSNISQSFTVRLSLPPTGTVTIPLNLGDASEGSFSSSAVLTTRTLTFDQNNWSTLQSVYVYSIDDFVADGNQTYDITAGPIASVDATYDGLTVDTVSVTNNDDDTAAFTVSKSSVQTAEWGGSVDFTVVLNTEPTLDVVIPVNSVDATEGLVSSLGAAAGASLELVFTPADWVTPQTITVNSVDDIDQDGNISYNINIGAPTGAVEYLALLAQTVAVLNVDDETAAVNIQGADLQTTEAGGTDSFVVSLAKAPVNDVVINITSNNTSEGRVEGGNSPSTALDAITLTFTTADWQTAQIVTVIGQDDLSDDGNQAYSISVAVDTVLTLDSDYNVLSAQSVLSANADNDTAGLTVGSYIAVYESGTTDSFTVKLNTQPTADVIVPVSIEDMNEVLISSGASGFVGALNLTFTMANWNTAQTVTVQAVDDFIDENTEYFDMNVGPATSIDLSYDGLPAIVRPVTTYDDDTAGFAITPSTGLVVSEDGTSSSFTLALTAEPLTNIFVTVSSANTSEGLLSGGDSPSTQVDVVTLEFTTANWQSAQTVIVHGQDDIVLDGPIVFDLTVDALTSTDTKYNNLNMAYISVSNSDNEATNAEGSVAAPISITSPPYSGLVDTTASYYVLSGLSAGINYDFSASSVTDNIGLYVYSNSDFSTGLLCSSVTTGTKVDEICSATTTSDTVYIKIDGSLTENGAGFSLGVSAMVVIETFPNGNASAVDTYIELYHSSDLTTIVYSDDDDGTGTYSRLAQALISGDTYYLKVRGYGSGSVGAYSVWVTNTATTPVSTVVPVDSDGEPGDDTSAGAVLLTLEVIADRTLTSGDNDWFMFTAP